VSARRPSVVDPLDAAFDALFYKESLPFEWIVEWSAGGGDPVTAAWKASAAPATMVRFLGLLDQALGLDAAVASASLDVPHKNLVDATTFADAVEIARMWRDPAVTRPQIDAALQRVRGFVSSLGYALLAIRGTKAGVGSAPGVAVLATETASDRVGAAAVCAAIRAAVAAPTLADVLAGSTP
jgi:hypothetical protein